jgi:hypothetical protein
MPCNNPQLEGTEKETDTQNDIHCMHIQMLLREKLQTHLYNTCKPLLLNSRLLNFKSWNCKGHMNNAKVLERFMDCEIGLEIRFERVTTCEVAIP